MKRIILLTVGLFTIAPLCRAEFRYFTNTSGDRIQAELVSHAKGQITIKRHDGVEFTVDPSVFSKSDQDYINEWIKKNPASIRYNLVITSNRNRVEGSSRDYGYKRVRNDLWSYVLTIRNNDQDSVKDLTLNYRVFYSNVAEGNYPAASSNITNFKMTEGSVKMEKELRFNHTVEVTTVPVRIDMVNYTSSRNRYRDELKGCIVRIVDKNNNVVMDWVSPEVAMHNRTWENTTPASARGTIIRD